MPASKSSTTKSAMPHSPKSKKPITPPDAAIAVAQASADRMPIGTSTAPAVVLPDDEIQKLYYEMLLLRRFEERTAQMYQMQKIKGFCHLYIGQEAVAVGSVHALKPQDYIFTTYRDHAHALIRGITPREVMAELFAKATGCSKGKGGSMHLFNAETRMMGGNGIVAGHVPVATGTAFKSAYNGLPEVTVCYFGDSVTNQGVYHESLNMASLWNLPIVYICENNLYGMGTAVHRASAEDRQYLRTEGPYRIPGYRVNGMDVLEMYKVTKEAVDRARAENRPTFIEAITYRYRGHSMSDPATAYRTKDEVGEWRSMDPLERLAQQFPKVLTEAWIEEQETKIKDIVQDSIDFAEASPFPDPSELYTDIYVNHPDYPV